MSTPNHPARHDPSSEAVLNQGATATSLPTDADESLRAGNEAVQWSPSHNTYHSPANEYCDLGRP